MGEAEKITSENLLIIHSVFYFYGSAAGPDISNQIAIDIKEHWNSPHAVVFFKNDLFRVLFDIEGFHVPELRPADVYKNTNPRNNYFRIEPFAIGNISFVDGLGSNTGYFKLENLLNNSTTAAHEYGHTLGLDHPKILDIRGNGQPGIMYPRGTLVDPEFQYDPVIPAGMKGGTLNPFTRKVFQEDIDHLRLNRLYFDKQGLAKVGDFSSVWHEAQNP
jgi:hypothetical protein